MGERLKGKDYAQRLREALIGVDPSTLIDALTQAANRFAGTSDYHPELAAFRAAFFEGSEAAQTDAMKALRSIYAFHKPRGTIPSIVQMGSMKQDELEEYYSIGPERAALLVALFKTYDG